jgi:hypothetical protein
MGQNREKRENQPAPALEAMPVPPMPRDRKWHRDTKREWRSWYEAGVPALWSPAQAIAARQLLLNVEAMHTADAERDRRIIGRQVRLERNDLGLSGRRALEHAHPEPKPRPKPRPATPPADNPYAAFAECDPAWTTKECK